MIDEQKIDDGGPAFPKQAVLGPNEDRPNETTYWEQGCDGLTKREWFAGKALENQQIMAMAGFDDQGCKAIASRAYAIADAMIRLGKRP